MARAFSFRAIRAVRGADRRGPRRAPDAGALWRAFRTAEEVRARSLADELATGRDWRDPATDPQEDELRARLTVAAIAPGSPNPAAGRRRSRNTLRCATRSRRRARNSMPIAFARAEWPHSRPRSRTHWRRCSRQLPPDTAVLAYFVGDDSSHAWLLTRSELRHASSSRPRPAAAGHRRGGGCAAAVARPALRRTRLWARCCWAVCSMASTRPACWCWPTARSTACRSRRCRCPALAASCWSIASCWGMRHRWRWRWRTPGRRRRATRASPWSPTRCTPPTIAGCSVVQERRLRHFARCRRRPRQTT